MMKAPPHILLIITGSVAACKSLDLIRMLKEEGCEVTCVLTRAGEAFGEPGLEP